MNTVLSLIGDPAHWSESAQGSVGLAMLFCFYACGWLYHAIPESSKKQATIGKRAVGIVVADVHGGPATFVQCSVRFFFRTISALPLGLGFLLATFTRRRQTLHDIAANCVVIQHAG